MKEFSSGYVFETVFFYEKTDSGPALVSQRVNSQEQARRITTVDRRAMPGRPCRVRVVKASAAAVEVEFLGLVDFTLDDGIYVDPELLRHFEILLCSGRSLLLEGPQGTGKTTVARALAKSLGFEYVFFNCSVCFEPSDFVGSLQLKVGENGQAQTDWIKTDVARAVESAQQNPNRRYLIFLDELNRCRSQALNGIMSAIDSSRRLYDPATNRDIDIPENIQWVAAINRGRQFLGTHGIDPAQLDRFAILKMSYLPATEEVRLLCQRYPSVKEQRIEKIVRVANLLRIDPHLSSGLSMRATDEAAMFLSYPSYLRECSNDDLLSILRTSFCNRYPGHTEEEGSEAHAALNIVMRGLASTH